MEMIFAKVLRMSMTASIVIVVVCLARLILRKAPKKASYLLWAVVLFRLLCPLSIPSPISFLPQETTAQTVVSRWSDTVNTEIHQNSLPVITFSESISETIPTKESVSISPSAANKTVEAALPPAVVLWISGMGCFGIYSLISLRTLRQKIGVPVRFRNNIYYGDTIRSPFILGIVIPKIYLPTNLLESEQEYIIAHEEYHIRHADHLVKLLFFAALCIHWFNPMVWLAFCLFNQDMEMRCDEAIVSKMGSEKRADYCDSLLNLAVRTQIPAGFPLSFGGSNTMHRIKNLAITKKTGFGFVALTLIFSIALSACLATDPAGSQIHPTAEAPSIHGEEASNFQLSNQSPVKELDEIRKDTEMYAALKQQAEDAVFYADWRKQFNTHSALDAELADQNGNPFSNVHVYQYEGGEMKVKVRLHAQGHEQIGLLLFLNGKPQPYFVENDTLPAYMKIFEQPAKPDCYVDLIFTPIEGKEGDQFELTVLPIADPNFSLADHPAHFEFTTLSRNFRATLDFSADAPEIQIPVIPNRILSLEETVTELYDYQKDYVNTHNLSVEFEFPYTFSVNNGNCHYPHLHNAVHPLYNTDFSEPVTVTVSLFGDDIGEYCWNLFVNNQPVTNDALSEIHVEPGTKKTVTVTLDLSDCTEEAVIYGFLAAKNFDGYQSETGAAQDVLITSTYILSSAENIYEVLGISDLS